MTILRSVVALGLLATVLVSACQPEGRTFEITLSTEFNAPLRVVMTDATGLVTGISQSAIEPATIGNNPAVRADKVDPNGLVLTWLGGGCDQDTDVGFQVLHGRYVLNLAIHEKPGTGCPAIAVPRAIRIATSRPIPVDTITVAGGS